MKLVPFLLGYLPVGMFLFTLGLIVPEISTEFRLKPIESALIFFSLVVSIATIQGVIGQHVDRIGAPKVMFVGLVVFSVSLLLSSFSSSYYFFMLCLIFAGAGAGMMITSIYSMMGNYTEHSRGLLVGIANATALVGGLVGSPLSGYLVVTYGWRSSLLTLGMFGLVVMLVMIFSIISIDRNAFRSRDSNMKISYNDLIRTRNLISTLLALFLGNFAHYAVISWSPLMLQQLDNFDPFISGIVMGIFGLAGLFGAVLTGSLSDRLGRKKIVIITNLASALLIPAFVFPNQGIFTIAMIAIIIGFTSNSFWNLIISLAQDSVKKGIVGSVTGLVLIAGSSGMAISPLVASILFVNLGIGWALILTGSIPFLLSSISLLFFRDTSKKYIVEA